MPQLDATKEEIAYLKLWLGIAVVTDISLSAWAFNNFRSTPRLFFGGAVVLIVGITYGCIMLHRRVNAKIEELRSV